jgi:hypothetical protein
VVQSHKSTGSLKGGENGLREQIPTFFLMMMLLFTHISHSQSLPFLKCLKLALENENRKKETAKVVKWEAFKKSFR